MIDILHLHDFKCAGCFQDVADSDSPIDALFGNECAPEFFETEQSMREEHDGFLPSFDVPRQYS
jgi:hypothetical protein